MFSGIVETKGKIIACDKKKEVTIEIQPLVEFDDVKIGDSIAVNGVCLTVTNIVENRFCMTIVPETLSVTTLSNIDLHQVVNLERSLKFSDRIGGHYVQGHVDGVGEITAIKSVGDRTLLLTIYVSDALSKYIIKKGFITIDGMSITVIDIVDNHFTVTLIPHTQAVTVAEHYQVGSKVNIEIDLFAKYIEKYRGIRHDS